MSDIADRIQLEDSISSGHDPEQEPKGPVVAVGRKFVVGVVGALFLGVCLLMADLFGAFHRTQEQPTVQQGAGGGVAHPDTDAIYAGSAETTSDMARNLGGKFGGRNRVNMGANGDLVKSPDAVKSLQDCPVIDAAGDYDPYCKALIINRENAANNAGTYPGSSSAQSGATQGGQAAQQQPERTNSHAAPLDLTASAETAKPVTLLPTSSMSGHAPEPEGIAPKPHTEEQTEFGEQDSVKPRQVRFYHCDTLCEGDYIPLFLVNRVIGDAEGSLIGEVVNDVVDHTPEHRLLIPQGSKVFGTASAVKGVNQNRIFAAFHSVRLPNGVVFSLDQYPMLDQQGAAGAQDLVNRHYFKSAAVIGALGALGALSSVGVSYNGTNGYNPANEFRTGVTSQVSQEATQILQQQLNTLPTMTLREGRNYLQVYVRSNLELKRYDEY